MIFMKAVKTLISTLIVLTAFFVLFDFCIYFVVFSPGYLMNRYRKYDVAGQLSMTETDLRSVTELLTDYVKGKEDSIEITVPVRGKEDLFYNEKDLSHMRDVRQIIITIRDLMILSVFAVFLFAIFLIKGKDVKAFRNGTFIAIGFIVLLATVVAVAANVNLDWMIVFCHNIFFNNSDWLLDPRVDNLIYLCPEQLFIDAGKVCGIIWISFLVIVTVFTVLGQKLVKNVRN